MSDDIAVGGPGATSILTTALEQQAYQFSQMNHQLASSSRQLGSIDRIIGNGILTAADAPQSALLAERAIDEAEVSLVRLLAQSDSLSRKLARAAHEYEFVENLVMRLGNQLAAKLAYEIGLFLPFIVALVMPGTLLAGAAAMVGWLALPPESRRKILTASKDWLLKHSAVISDPAFVQTLRLTVMSADDFGAGFARLPPELAAILGDEGLGITGVDTSAAVLLGAAATVGVMKETSVGVTAIASTTRLPMTNGIRDRAERIPMEPQQIRIDCISTPGQPDRFEVYIAGTAEATIGSSSEPWDMTSNVTAVAGGNAGSYRAVVEAMHQAGVVSSSEVTLTGYSQGGLVAAQLAASGDYNVDGLLTFGAPAGQVAVPTEIPYLAVEHTNDIVPALGGDFASSDPTIARRQLFDGPPPPSDFAVPAHRLDSYVETAGLIDESTNAQLQATLGRLHHDSAQSITSTIFRSVRK